MRKWQRPTKTRMWWWLGEVESGKLEVVKLEGDVVGDKKGFEAVDFGAKGVDFLA